MKLYKLSADALTCEQLNENGVRNSAVNDAGLFNATSHSLNAAVYFRYHTATDDFVLFKAGNLADIYNRNQRVFVVLISQQSSYIRHKDKLASTELCGYFSRRNIGVDVEHFTLVAACYC